LKKQRRRLNARYSSPSDRIYRLQNGRPPHRFESIGRRQLARGRPGNVAGRSADQPGGTGPRGVPTFGVPAASFARRLDVSPPRLTESGFRQLRTSIVGEVGTAPTLLTRSGLAHQRRRPRLAQAAAHRPADDRSRIFGVVSRQSQPQFDPVQNLAAPWQRPRATDETVTDIRAQVYIRHAGRVFFRNANLRHTGEI
jgi:hypothetical protein